MAKSSIVIDLDDPRSGKIAEVISNKTSKKILSVLADNEMSGSEIASKLDLPLNTVTYNLKKLVDAGLAEKVDRVFWSSKGKKMEIFKLSNKQIVISPKKMIRGILPAILFSIIVALLLNFFVSNQQMGAESSLQVRQTAPSSEGASFMAQAKLSDSAAQPENSEGYGISQQQQKIWAWYLIGAMASLAFLILWNTRRNN